MEKNGPYYIFEKDKLNYKVEPNVILKDFSILLKKCDCNITMPRSTASTSQDVSNSQDNTINEDTSAKKRKESVLFDPKVQKRPRGLSKREKPDDQSRSPSFYPRSGIQPSRNRRSFKSIKQNRTRGRIVKDVGNSRKSMSDDNSDDSENSDLYDDINWEENIEADTISLLDEFAPPTAHSPTSESQDGSKDEEVEEKPMQSIVEAPKVEEQTIQEEKTVYEFVSGSEINVKDYNSSDWYTGNVIEVDWEEEEVLVHFKDSTKSDEWVSMNSQRLSQNRPATSTKTVAPLVSSVKVEKAKKIEPGAEKRRDLEDEMKLVRKSNRGTLQKRFHKHMKKSPQASSSKNHTGKAHGKDRFEVGEKVLAKWSDHRMQKFPAIIKRVLRNGTYDVLFYDGFEKTLNRDYLYKTTEEEIAKYQQSNPSEADSFVDMDIGSKEERRQRKRKTFDDFLFLKDFERPRKKAHSFQNEIEKLTPVKSNKNSGSFSYTEKKPSLSSMSPQDDQKLSPTLHNLLVKSRHLKRKKKSPMDSSMKEDNLSDDLSEYQSGKDGKPEGSGMQSPKQEFAEIKTKQETPSSSAEEPSDSKKTQNKPEVVDRWTGDIPPDAHPTIITGIDGIPRKTVILPDRNLPTGWSKHAVMRQSGGHWESFLVSPDGCRIHSQQTLQDYYQTYHQCEPPETLDFNICVRSLPELVLRQKDRIAKGTYPKWEKKRGRRRKSFTSDDNNSPVPQVRQQVGRVKTLLPKYRNVQPPAQVPPSAQSSSPAESEVWRCPKQGCDKKFRKENLLQMHIKHYHVEFKALVGAAPKVEDLACARSESANSDWRVEHNKPLHGSIKRIMPKQHGNIRGNFMDKSFERPELDHSVMSPQISMAAPGHTPSQALTMTKAEIPSQEDPPMKRQPPAPPEEKKSTIKTIFPLRHAVQETVTKSVPESEDGETDDEESLNKNPRAISMSKMYRINRTKKPKLEPKFSTMAAPMDDIGMRDHGYPMYNRFIKKKQIPALEKLQITTDSNDSYTEEEKASPNTEGFDDSSSVERLQSEELINCTCGIKEEDGLMIQCDICLCWQHGLCNGIKKESEVPESYVCCICQNPYRVRSSRKFNYAQIYLTQAKLPTLSFRTSKQDEIKHRETMLKRCYDISTSLHQIQNVERSLRAKLSIAEQPDHPKLYLWAKNWDENSNMKTDVKDELDMKDELLDESQMENEMKTENEIKTRVPEPEAPIDLEECRLKLLDHVELYQQHVESRLSTIEAQIAALEAQDPDLASVESNERYPHMKQTVHMLIRDLATVRKVAVTS